MSPPPAAGAGSRPLSRLSSSRRSRLTHAGEATYRAIHPLNARGPSFAVVQFHEAGGAFEPRYQPASSRVTRSRHISVSSGRWLRAAGNTGASSRLRRRAGERSPSASSRVLQQYAARLVVVEGEARLVPDQLSASAVDTLQSEMTAVTLETLGRNAAVSEDKNLQNSPSNAHFHICPVPPFIQKMAVLNQQLRR